MKKFLILLFLMAIGTSVYAQQKKYVNVVASYVNGGSTEIYITGSKPSNMESHYTGRGLGGVLNALADE